MVTKADVAKAAGVSTATVTRVVSGKGYTSPDAREKVNKAIEALKYRPNKVASNLAKNSSNVIGVLMEDLLNPYYTHIMEAMVEYANEKDYIVSLFVINERDAEMVLDNLIANRICGLVNLSLFPCNEEQYMTLQELGIKIINMSVDTGKGMLISPYTVNVDYTIGMDMALNLLHEKGLKDVAFVVGLNEKVGPRDKRVKRYYERMEELNMTRDPRLVRFANYPMEKAHKIGYTQTINLIDSGVKFNALFCLTDMMAMGAIKALTERHLRIPEDVSLIGCDNLDFTDFYTPALTTISVDKKAQGRAYVDLITGNTEDSMIVIPTSLVVRDSVK